MREKIKQYLLSLTSFIDYWKLIKVYMDNYLLDERVNFQRDFMIEKQGNILVLVIRCNERIDFNGKPMNNDLLVVVEYVGLNNYNVFTFNVTADPKAKNNNIAHLIKRVIGVISATIGKF